MTQTNPKKGLIEKNAHHLYEIKMFPRFFSYHQKVPLETPVLDSKIVHGLATPEEYVYPDKHALWNLETYDSFNLSKAVDAKLKPENSKAKVPAPNEAPM